jgi:hypothetical protein
MNGLAPVLKDVIAKPRVSKDVILKPRAFSGAKDLARSVSNLATAANRSR